ESEIDPIPEQIPSQTFTNQNFSGGPGAPPAAAAAPLPPHFVAPAGVPQQPPMGTGPAPTVANHQSMQPIGNNGVVDNGLMGQHKEQPHHVVKEQVMQAAGPPPRTQQTQQHQQRGQHPPRPRPVNARH
ncbi:unnamed protein product, partial [Acanthoscelides obtectus]